MFSKTKQNKKEEKVCKMILSLAIRSHLPPKKPKPRRQGQSPSTRVFFPPPALSPFLPKSPSAISLKGGLFSSQNISG